VRSPPRPRGLVGRLHDRSRGCWGNGRCHDSVPAHCSRAGHVAMPSTFSSTMHQRLGRFQPSVCRELPIPLRQTDAAMGSQIHQRQSDEALRSFLTRFQTMRIHILEVAEAVVIEDFYRGSNDSAFVRAILQKVSATSEQLFREADIYITADERAQDLIGGTKPHPRHLGRT
jgi:hypothetical protein